MQDTLVEIWTPEVGKIKEENIQQLKEFCIDGHNQIKYIKIKQDLTMEWIMKC